MPTVPPRALAASLASGAPVGAIVVLHGGNEALKGDLLKAIQKAAGADPHDPFRVVRLESGDLESDPARLADELTAVSMFGGSRLVVARCAPRRLVEHVELALALPRGDCVLVLACGPLTEPQELRTLAANNAALMDVECAEEDSGDFRVFVLHELSARDIALDAEALETFLRLVGEDRPAARAEIEKASCYLGEPGALTSQDIISIVADGAGVVSDTLALAAIGGRIDSVAAGLDQIEAAGVDAQQALLSAARQSLGLHKAKVRRWHAADQGPGRLLTESDLRDISHALNDAVLRARRDAFVGSAAGAHSLLALARSVQNKARRPRR
jgi:DNA polymerase-3 subunit delta